MSKLYLDSETCGLHSMMVLLQWAQDEGPITLHEVWRRSVRDTLRLIEWLCEHTVVGFNLAFDWFHIAKTYTIFRLCDPDWIPGEHVNEIALLEPRGQDGPCVKPACALDLMLHSRKGPYQSLMAREDIRIKRVPSSLAYALAGELEGRGQLDNIYFARSADPDAPKWQVFDRRDRFGDIDTDFKDVVLKFNPAGGLKFLAEHAMGYKPKFHFKDVEPPPSWRPYELGYAPTALAVSRPEWNWEVWGRKKGRPNGNFATDEALTDLVLESDHDDDVRGAPHGPEDKLLGHAWPAVIGKHIEHWATRPDAREYANDDIVYTRALDKHFGCPAPGDNDSTLACMVPVIRWHGFNINKPGMQELLAKAQAVVANSPVNIHKPGDVRAYVTAAMDATEAIVLSESTKKSNLEAIANWEIETREPCGRCQGTLGCARCGGTGFLEPGKHPAATRAKEVLAVKIAGKEVELYDKLLLAGKFHASFVVIGTLSSRMAGADGLNPQGIKHAKDVRRMFPLAWEDMILCGGDFDSFEVTIADAVYNDPALRKDLTTKGPCPKCAGTGRDKKSGKPCGECETTGLTPQKLHALFGMALSGLSYAEVVNSSGAESDWYDKGKRGVFALVYGGDWNTLVQKLAVTETRAKAAYADFVRRYPGIDKARRKTFDAFCSMRQPAGIGSAVIWATPAEYVETFLGFRRYFTLENKICHALFDLARNTPKHWREVKIKVVRRDRVQTAAGAVASALYGAAFQMQAANMRAAANHEIQSPGAEITKSVQRALWDLQPAGIHPLMIAPLNVHDELMTVTRHSLTPDITATVRRTVESFRDKVPLIGMTWFEAMDNWAEKKGGAAPVKIRAAEML
jgi:hypothetical protein